MMTLISDMEVMCVPLCHLPSRPAANLLLMYLGRPWPHIKLRFLHIAAHVIFLSYLGKVHLELMSYSWKC